MTMIASRRIVAFDRRRRLRRWSLKDHPETLRRARRRRWARAAAVVALLAAMVMVTVMMAPVLRHSGGVVVCSEGQLREVGTGRITFHAPRRCVSSG
jgi:ferric-dicitrate binding protein FerR (iron transport regulator)